MKTEDPKRAFESGLSPFARSLLIAGRAAAPDARERDATWAAIVQATATVPVRAPADAPGSPRAPTANHGGLRKSLARGTTAKYLAFLSAGAIGLIGGMAVLRGGHFQGSPTAARATEMDAPISLPPPPVDTGAANAAPPLTTPSPSSVPSNRIHRPLPLAASEESDAIRAARRALRNGEPLTALRLLDAAERRFGNGMLTQEREALTITALARTGRAEDAKTRGEAFLRQYPESPHADAVRALGGL